MSTSLSAFKLLIFFTPKMLIMDMDMVAFESVNLYRGSVHVLLQNNDCAVSLHIDPLVCVGSFPVC